MKVKSACEMFAGASLTLLVALGSLILVSVAQAQESATNASSVGSDVQVHPAQSVPDMLVESYQDFAKGAYDVALGKVNDIIKLNSQNKEAYMLRASIYAQQKEWDKADYDYDVALVIDPNNAAIKFDLAELKFMQKKYDEARLGFVEVTNDKEIGDFATYKIFLCDLFGAHEDVAARELDALNQIGGNPSYYFGNAAWDLVHHKTEDAAGWLESAAHIYANTPQKFANYTASLTDLGYLPIHPSATQ